MGGEFDTFQYLVPEKNFFYRKRKGRESLCFEMYISKEVVYILYIGLPNHMYLLIVVLSHSLIRR